MTRKYSSTSTETTLSSGINTTQTTMQVPSAAAATALLGGVTLAAGNVDIFTVVIDPDTVNEEVVFITDVSGDTFTISRGQAGTGTAGVSGIAHSAGATIRHVLTSSDLDFFRNGVATADAAIAKSTLTAKGNILTATASATPAVLSVGTNGQVLKADSSTATGLAWGSDLGRILQVVEGTTTSSASGSTYGTYFDTNLTATITPSSASNKVLVLVNQNGLYISPGAAAGAIGLRLVRTSTAIASIDYGNTNYGGYTQLGQGLSLSKLDSPATTSAVTYKTQAAPTGATGTTVGVQYLSQTSTIILMEVAV